MPQRASPSRPFASAPNRAGPTLLFSSVPQSLPMSTQERPPRRAANQPGLVRPDEGASWNDAAAHRAAALALDEPLGCPVAQNDAAAHRAVLALDGPPGCHVAQDNFRGEGDAPQACARATAVQSLQTVSRHALAATHTEQLPVGARAHADAADAVSDPGFIAAFVELVHLGALLEVEDSFRESARTATEQPTRLLHHDHALAEARWRAGVVARCQERRAAKMQSIIADSNDATCPRVGGLLQTDPQERSKDTTACSVLLVMKDASKASGCLRPTDQAHGRGAPV